VLNRADEVSDMQTGRLRAIHQGLVALDRMVEADLASASPTELADAIRLVFDAHEAFTYEITQFFASLNQWQSRYDLDGDELQFFAEILVGYVSEQLHEIERLARPIALVLADLEPVLDQLIARADAGLAKRVDDAGLTGKVAVRALAGTQRRDWDYLSSWYRSGPSSRSRLDELTSQAVQAVRTLTANLTRLSGAGMGSASRRSDFVKLARWIDQAATIEDAHRLVAAAFGLGPSRHLGAVAADDDDPVPTTTPWADAPRAVVPVSVRQRGETTMRGRPTRMRDRSADREVLRLRRQRLAEAARRTTVELLASAGPDGSVNGSKLSAAAFVRLRDLIGRSSHHLRAGQPVRRFSDGELVCEVSRRSGAETTVETDDGRLRMIDVEVRVGPAGAGAGGHSG
jgi:uncharacterized protein (TIGR02677 family)